MIIPLTIITGALATPLAATAALSFGLGAVATAMAPGRNTPPRPQRRHHAQCADSTISQLRETLSLNSRQDTLWRQAEKADWDFNGQMLARLRTEYEKTHAMLNEPGIDIPTVAMQMENFRAGEQRLLEARQERWQALYDALNAGQKKKISPLLRNQLQ